MDRRVAVSIALLFGSTARASDDVWGALVEHGPESVAPAPAPAERPMASNSAQLQALRAYSSGLLTLGTADVAPRRRPLAVARSVDRSWAVYRGGLRLEVPEYLSLVGETERAATLQAQIDRRTATARTYGVVGGVGASVAAIGVVAMSAAATRDGYRVGGALVVFGAVGAVAGYGLGVAPRRWARRDAYLFADQLAPVEVLDQVDAANEALRRSLGIPAELAWRMEGASR